MEQLNQILERLNCAGVEYVVVGGLAAVFHGVPLVTRDIDNCMPMTQPNLDRLESAIADLNSSPTDKEQESRRMREPPVLAHLA